MSRNKQLKRFERYSTLLLYFCNTEIIHKEVTRYFKDKIVALFIEREIFELYDFISMTKEDAKKLFSKSDDFRQAVDALYKVCTSEIPQDYNHFSEGDSYLLIKPFRDLNNLDPIIGNKAVDIKYTDYPNIKAVLSKHNVETYHDLFETGIEEISNISGFGEKGYRAIADIIEGERIRTETGEIIHTKRWDKKDAKKVSNLDKALKEIDNKLKKVSNKSTLQVAYKTVWDENGEFYTIPVPIFPEKKSKKKPSKKKKIQKKKTKPFSLYALASGKPGKKFTVKQFLEITKRAKKKPGGAQTDLTMKLSDGYVYEADSKQEMSVLKKLIKHDAFLKLRGQCINIQYRYAGKNHNYYPDFIILTQTNKIIIMEVKEIAQMNVKQNIRKYNALKRYCEKKEYLYIMCDKSFTPFEKLSEKHSLGKVDKAIEDAIDEKGFFDYSDYQELVSGCNAAKVRNIRKSIGIYVASYDDIKMNGDLTHDIHNLRIFVKKSKDK